uniref:PELP1 middle domain-containing protein n=1 Tax=Astatotilapia calliptera TaxID=8154 RepID=A0A3P8Q2I3_ASTCA
MLDEGNRRRFCLPEVTHTRLLLAVTDGAMQYQGPGMELAFPHLDPTDPLLLLQLQHRYTAVCLALKHTLRVDPASAVRLPVRPMLNLVCRALAVSSKSINLTGDGSVRLLVLPIIHSITLEVLSSVITVVRVGMVQYAAVIQRLFSQTLSAWTPLPETSVGQQRAYSAVRVSVYRTLELWVQVAGASSSILQGSPGHSELLFNHLLGDITPGAESVKKRHKSDHLGKPGPRRTKHLVMADTVGPSLQRKGDHLANQDTCLAAVRALRQIIQSSGTLLKDDIHKRLHEVVLPLCVRLQQQQSCSSNACESAGSASGQYSSALTRRELYRLLLALVLVPSPCWPPPLTCAVSILSNGRTDRNVKVSSFCAEALTICNLILHPRFPSIALPLPPLTMKPSSTTPVLPSSQGPAPGLTLPTLLGGPAPGPPFPARHSVNLGPASLLSSFENHLSLVPGLPGQGPTAGDMILSPHSHHQPDPAGLGPPEGQRPVFVRFDKEEAEDVEISLASDSDDSVVIVPPGMLNMETQQDDAAANSQSMSSSAPGGTGVTLAGAESVTMVPTTAAAATIDGVSLPNDLAASSPLLTASTTSINSFPPSSASVVSLVPPLNSSTFTAPPVGLGESLPGRPQLQQMLMQPSTASQAGPMGLPLQMHLQNQLSQQGRHLHQQPAAAASSEDSAVININSTDDEEEDDEDIDEDEELEEDEEEEGIDEEDEEEDVSELADEFFDGEEYEELDEEDGEDLEEEEEEEEEEEDGDIPPLEGVEDKDGGSGIQEGKLDEGRISAFNVEERTEGGIEEIQTNRALFGEDTMKVQEVESIGVLEAAREGEVEEEDNERMDDPTMEQAGAELQKEECSWEQGAKEDEPQAAESEQPASQQVDPEEDTEKSSEKEAEQPETGAGGGQESNGEEGKGVKRKREEGHGKEEVGQSPEKKKMDDEAMASMLADFVACPPDDEDGASGSKAS